MKNGTYYFWKWAANDLPGRPLEVLPMLLAGSLHPALQLFDARPLIAELAGVSKFARPSGEEWEWEVVPKNEPDRARFVFVQCPNIKASVPNLQAFMDVFFPFRLSGFDEQTGQLIPGLPPKINCFINGQTPEERVYDIHERDLPRLLKKIDPCKSSAFAVVEDQHSRAVHSHADGQRFRVEWWENEGARETPPDWTRLSKYRAQDCRRLSALNAPYDRNRKIPYAKNPDLLPFEDVLAIFRAFLNGRPRPAEYHWMEVTSWIDEDE